MFSGIIEAYGKVVSVLSNWMYSYILIILLVGAGIYFTVRTKVINHLICPSSGLMTVSAITNFAVMEATSGPALEGRNERISARRLARNGAKRRRRGRNL